MAVAGMCTSDFVVGNSIVLGVDVDVGVPIDII